MMSILVERYEQERYPLEPSKPGEMIQFLMEQRGFQQRDLAKVLGSKSHLSEILSGKREPSKGQAKSSPSSSTSRRRSSSSLEC